MKNKYNIVIIILSILIVAIIVFLIISLVKKPPELLLDKTSITIKVYEEERITPIVKNLDEYTLLWESSNNNVATVNDGLITGKSRGSATITVRIKDYDVLATANVIVNDIEIEDIKLSDNNIELTEGDSYTLSYSITPSNATNRNISWEVSNQDIINFDNGNIKALSKGTSVVTIKTYNGLSDTCNIKVKEKIIDVTEIKVEKDNYNLYVGDSVTIHPVVLPENATNKEITSSSSDNTIATINNNVIKGLKVGKTTITLKSNNNITKKINVTVSKKPVEIRVASMNIGAYHCGSSSTKCNTTPQSLANLFKEYKISIIGTQEAEPESKSKQIPNLSGLTYYYYVRPISSNTIMSKYKFISKNKYNLPSCNEARVVQKVVVNINGVNISFYNTHFSYQSKCHDIHFKAMADIIKNDPNPAILVGDMNITSKSYYEKYYKPLGYEIAAYDPSTNNLHKTPTYCNSIYVKGLGHIKIKDGKHIETFGKYTDHNMTLATLEIS